MNSLRKLIRDSIILTNIEEKMKNILTANKVEELPEKAETISLALGDFRAVVRAHRKITFAYKDVLKNESDRYGSREVAFIYPFDGKMYRTPFSKLIDASKVVIKKNGNPIARPANLKIGNQAIGQAWLSDGTEVFCPYEALNHSMNSTAKMLLGWSKNFKNQLAKQHR